MRKKKYLTFALATSLFLGMNIGTVHASPQPLGPGKTVVSQAKIPSQSKINAILNSADKYIGTPYKWGTAPYSPTNRYFDCSSFVQKIFGENNIPLKRNSRDQSTEGKTVVSVPHPEQFIGKGTAKPKGERLHFNDIKHLLKKGDLIFFDNKPESPNLEQIHHVAIYINEHTLLHATETYGVNYTFFNPERKNNIVIVKRLVDESIPLVKQSDIIATGEKYLGTRFSNDPDHNPGTVNASKFVKDVFAKHGIPLPNTANDMSKVGIDVPKNKLKAGDLVFFDNDHDGVITHVAIYINQNKLLHATASQGVAYTEFSSYWKNAFVKGKRILDLKGPLPLNEEVLQTAKSYVGKKQIEDIEAVKPDGKPKLITPDSSKFVQKVFYDHYVGMSRTSNTQRTQGVSIPLKSVKTGDLVFFDSNRDKKSDYVAFYINSKTILLSSSKSGIQYKPLTDKMKKEMMAVKRVAR